MRKTLFVVVLVSLFFSCSKEDLETVNVVLGQEIRLKEGQAALYNNSGLDAAPTVKLKVEDVRDGRCPSDVVCVTYGSVEVILVIVIGHDRGETLTLCLGDCAGRSQPEDEAVVRVGTALYKVRLLGVSPLPNTKEKSGQVKEVQLVLEPN
ncbi:hypothetical protein I0P70_01740 [Pontibacter sp. FD36]|uniref:hypothetical protein n=1 Tax=Pontibacter sp. FD36 TaxID=2789860 RepID=UPI0018ABB0FC|nr:hypothetical protein [Pontibacter sp. FD36]MBF8961953.1 hypothetical protein [Pontibacter sp. FD36]